MLAEVGRWAGRELLIALVALILFLFTGKYVLRAMHVSEPAMTISARHDVPRPQGN